MADCECEPKEPKPEPEPKPKPKPKPKARFLVPDGKWFKYSDTGKKVYMAFQADPENWIWRGDRPRTKILNNMIKYGGNALALYSIQTHGGDAKWENRTDMNPWIKFEPRHGINKKTVADWYKIAQKMDANNKILIFNFRDDETKPYGKNKSMVKVEKDYHDYIIKTFKGLTHVVWLVAEEYSEIMSQAYAKQVARYIRDRDPHHPIAIHQTSGSSFDFSNDKYKGEQLFNSFFMQSVTIGGRMDLRGRLRRAVKQAQGRYNVCMFEGTDHDGLIWGHGEEAMRKAEICAAEGAYFGWYDRGGNKYSAAELKFLKRLQSKMERKINVR